MGVLFGGGGFAGGAFVGPDGGFVGRGAGCGCSSFGVDVNVKGMYVDVGVEIGVGDCVLVGEDVKAGVRVVDGMTADVGVGRLVEVRTNAGAISLMCPRGEVGVAEPEPVFGIIKSGL